MAVADVKEMAERTQDQTEQLSVMQVKLLHASNELEDLQATRDNEDLKIGDALELLEAKTLEVARLTKQLALQELAAKEAEEQSDIYRIVAQSNLATATQAASENEEMREQMHIIVKILLSVVVIAIMSLFCNYLQFRRRGLFSTRATPSPKGKI